MLSGLKSLAQDWRYPVPAQLRARQRDLSEEGLQALRASISTHYHRGARAKECYTEATYRADLDAHLFQRLRDDRRIVVPWLNSVRTLRDMKILEVGCGTGSSTVALAEQGASVTGVDIDADALLVARERCRLHGLQAELQLANVTGTGSLFQQESFDLVIIFACLEHMTVQERLEGLPTLWRLLKRNGLLAVIETPNRLWLFDEHTSLMPFFHWLPDELAFRCSRFSGRAPFKDEYRELTADRMVDFLRWGRGASFHEFDAALGTHDVLSSLSSFHGYRYTLRRTWKERRYKALIRSVRPDLHDGWFEPWLDILIEKHGATGC
jgi:S-adenosylmethionine-dependent methyltransferase